MRLEKLIKAIGSKKKIEVLLFLFKINESEDFKAISYTDLLTELKGSSTTLSKDLADLEEIGLISSYKDPKQHNKRTFTISPVGLKVAEHLDIIKRAVRYSKKGKMAGSVLTTEESSKNEEGYYWDGERWKKVKIRTDK